MKSIKNMLFLAGSMCVVCLIMAGCTDREEAEEITIITINSALSLDGTGDYMDVGSSANLMFSNDFTLECWAKPVGTLTSNWGALICRDAYPTKRNYWFGESHHVVPVSVGFEYLDERGIVVAIFAPSNALPEGEWTHCAITIDANLELIMYVNGDAVKHMQRLWDTINIRWVTQDEPDIEKPAEIPPAPDICTNIGASGTQRRVDFFSGLIDEVRIWNVARTQEEIQASMNATLTGQEKGLVGYWNFDDGSAMDLSPSGNHGTLFGDAQIIPVQRRENATQ